MARRARPTVRPDASRSSDRRTRRSRRAKIGGFGGATYGSDSGASTMLCFTRAPGECSPSGGRSPSLAAENDYQIAVAIDPSRVGLAEQSVDRAPLRLQVQNEDAV